MNNSGEKHLRRVLVVALALLACSGTVKGGEVWEILSERWYVIALDGVPAGTVFERVSERDGVLQTVEDRSLRVTRAGEAVTMRTVTTSSESTRGTPLSCLVHQDDGGGKRVSHWTFSESAIHQRVGEGADAVTTIFDRRGNDWLGIQAARRFGQARRSAGAERYSFRTCSPLDGVDIVDVTATFVGDDVFDFGGRRVDVGRWRMRWSSASDQGLEEIYDSTGVLMGARLSTGLGVLETRLSDRDEATTWLSNAGPDIVLASMVQLKHAAKRLTWRNRIRYVLSSQDGSPLPTLVEAGHQSVAVRADGFVEVEVDTRRRLAASDLSQTGAHYRDASSIIDFENEAIDQLGRSIAPTPHQRPASRCRQLSQAVGRHISSKDLGRTLASASETALTRRGDCTEHAVLLAALLRREEIPARVVIGLVYVGEVVAGEPGMFGWHMWTQAFVENAWLDLDATQNGSFHVGHIAISTMSLTDHVEERGMQDLVQLMGNLQIEVLRTR